MKKLFLFFAAALLAFGLFACDDGTDDSDSLDVTELEGSWITACVQDNESEYIKKALTITEYTVALEEIHYSDNICTAELGSGSYQGTFMIVGDGAVAGSHKMVIVWNDTSITQMIYLLSGGDSLRFGSDEDVSDSFGYPTTLDAEAFTKLML